MPLLQRNLILIGSGPHYREKYHEVLEKRGTNILLLIDLETSKETILRFFSDKALRPREMLFLEEKFRNQITVKEIEELLSQFSSLSNADGVIISTEPKIRKSYAIWAAMRALPIFMDKPITAFGGVKQAKMLLNDYHEIHSTLNKGKVNAVVSCERRANPGYLWLKKYLKSFIRDMKVPITSIDIHYAGGIFNLPHEYQTIENHPFQYQYGILLHSGYHYIDLLVQLLALNDPIINQADTRITLQTMVSRPSDQVLGVERRNYSSLLTSEELAAYCSEKFQDQMIEFGETDIMVNGQVLKGKRVVTNFSVRLFGTSLSLRQKRLRSVELPGRARQEHVILHLGHQCSIHLSSSPLKKLYPDRHPIENFDITVMNGPLVVKREPLIKIDREKISAIFPELPRTVSMNGYARKWQLTEFLNGKDGNSSFETHRNTVQLIDSIYTTIGKNESDYCRKP